MFRDLEEVIERTEGSLSALIVGTDGIAVENLAGRKANMMSSPGSLGRAEHGQVLLPDWVAWGNDRIAGGAIFVMRLLSKAASLCWRWVRFVILVMDARTAQS